MTDIQLLGTTWIYQRILEYCEARANGIGGYYREESYRHDYFKIFTDAEIGGFCGYKATQKYNRRCSKLKKKPSYRDYVVTAEGIQLFLREKWLIGKNKTTRNEEMVSTLCEWWDAWLFALGHYPRDYWSPRRSLQRVKAALKNWVEAQE